MKKKYGLIDILKLVFAIGIVAIHTNIFRDTNNILLYIIHKGLFRLAVPFFFTVSGFFLFIKLEKIQNTIQSVREYTKRLIIPLLFWVGIDFFPSMLIPAIINKEEVHIFILKTVRSLIFYPWGAMWYLLALIIATLIIVPFYKKKKLKKAVRIGSILYIFALICNNYYFIVEGTTFQKIVDLYLKIAMSARNGIFEGLYFVSVGMYISKLIDENKINHKINNIAFIITYILLIFEILAIKNYTYKDDGSLYIMFIPLIPCLLTFLLQFNIKHNTTKIRNYSSGVYFIHSFINKTLAIILILLNIELSSTNIFLIVLSTTLILLTILYKINNKYINMVIK